MARPIPTNDRDWWPRPKLYDEVEWGNFPSCQDYEQAYKAWSLPYETLRPYDDHMSAQEQRDLDSPLEVMVAYIHHFFRTYHRFEVPLPRMDSQRPPESESGAVRPGWKAADFLTLVSAQPVDRESLRINGKKPRALLKAAIVEELQARGLPTDGLKLVLAARLEDDMLARMNSLQPASDHCKDIYPRNALRHWGLNHSDQYLITFSNDSYYSPTAIYTMAIHLSPYNPAYWVARAFLFYQRGFYDLALGDAYRAQYLVYVVNDVSCRAKRPGLYPRIWDAIEQHVVIVGRDRPDVKEQLTKDQGVPYFVAAIQKTCHHLISLTLWHCRDFRAARQWNNRLPERSLMPSRDREIFIARGQRWEESENGSSLDTDESEDSSNIDFTQLGRIHQTQSPFDGPPIDLNEPSILERLNANYIQNWSGDGTPSYLELVASEDDMGGLRVIANRDIDRGQVIYADEPNIRGHLKYLLPLDQAEAQCRTSLEDREPVRYTDSSVPNDSCENCKRLISKTPLHDPHEVARQTYSEAVATDQANGNHAAVEALTHQCACLFRHPPMIFCQPPHPDDAAGGELPADGPANSRKRAGGLDFARPDVPVKRIRTTRRNRRREHEGDQPTSAERLSCLQMARKIFHHRACGMDWRWLHEAMQTTPIPVGNNEDVLANQREGTVLSLLLREVFDITLRKRERAIEENEIPLLAHQIDEMFPLREEKGDPNQQGFPFGMISNIIVPFDILESLGVNIFRNLDFDTWVIQLVLRKLLVNAISWRPTRLSTDLPRGPSQLYISTAFSFFEHSCIASPDRNADWGWDYSGYENVALNAPVPNRIIVTALKDIDKGEEIRLSYFSTAVDDDRDRDAHRYLGRLCTCQQCAHGRIDDMISPA